MDTYTFQDIFDIDFMQKLIDSLSAALQVGISIRGPQGERITKDSDYCSFCRDIVKKTPIGNARCEMSDRALSAHSDTKPYICHCQSAGLTDASVSILVEGRHLASILVGQVRLAEDVPDEEEYRTNARILQLDEDEFLEHVHGIPVITKAHFEDILDLLSLLANQFSQIGCGNLRLRTAVSSLEHQRLAHQQEKTVLETLAEKDSMTGLYNRRKFEEIMDMYAGQKGRRICMISADANFLKLTNDIFGHKAGDQLLINAAKIMDSLAKSDWLVARCGGDEFRVILPDTTLETALDYCRRVARDCGKDTTLSLPLSVALGAADWNSEHETLQDCFSRADAKMYQNKAVLKHELHVPDYIMDRLYDKQILSKKVVEYAAEMAFAFSRRLGLPQEHALEVSMAARYQDIGMAKLPESFYIRGQSRTEEESLRFKTHVTHGYTMARQFEELYKVADIILHSHESWDGKGYPNQLAGEQIPTESRIIHIVGDYTYWTVPTISGGNYSREIVIHKMRELAGSIYDPELTEQFFGFLEDYEHKTPCPD
ncbi:MAG: diguanylate cyclase [Lachnospiraceae bacterium]|jgi:diguanylate cyclase (GGDEF)-like protein|nr:PocR ligand-binding domain-containing protein [uncultured Acetatifactor sp.]MCI9219516.1 diguanylate cyclase [Lachnospiraceae bacterium]